jgi:signal transduction histidine kinase
MVRIFFVSISLLLFSGMYAQKTAYEKIDSLRKAVDNIPDTAKRQKALALHDLATAYMHIASFVQAASYYAESLDLATQLKEELLIALIYRNMSVLSFNQGNEDKTTEYHHKALAIYEKRNDNIRKAELLKLMADNMLTKGDSMNAHRYYEEAIDIFRKTGNRLGEAMAYANFSLVYSTRYPEKIGLAVKAKKIFDSLQTDNPIPATNVGNLGIAYFDIVRYNRMHLAPPGPLIPATKQELLLLADKYIREAITTAQSKQDVANAAYFSGLLAELQEYNGDYKNAYYNIRKYFETNDSIYSQENKNQIAALQNKQEMDGKNALIEQRNLQLSSQRTQLLLLAGVAVLLLTTGLLLYRQGQLRKKNNEVLQQLNRELATANRVKAKFFAILSHDLRSPIAKLVSFLQFRKLKPGALAESEMAEHERKIEDSAQSLLATMESMLLWSKEQMEHFQPVITKVNIQSVFDHIKRNFADTENISFDFSVDELLYIDTDENYLKAILYNLTSNAVKAVQTSLSPLIKWKAWKEASGIFFSITDNGPGISSEKAVNFFDGMSNTDSRQGLGLHIIRDLAKAIHCKLFLGQVENGMQVLLQFTFPNSASSES